MNGLLITGCEIDGVPGLDVRVRNGIVAEIDPNLAPDGDDVLAAAGGALLPGLHDHHLHVLAMAAALDSVPCGPPASVTWRPSGNSMKAMVWAGTVTVSENR